MSKHHPQSEGMKALEQSINDHMEICRLKREAKRLKADIARLKAEVERLTLLQVETLNERNKAEAEVERLQHLANQSDFYRSQLQKDTCRLENIQMQDAFKHYEAENARLKTEVERLRASSFVTAVPVEEYEKLKAEVERSTAQYNSIIDQQLDVINDLKTKVEHLDLFKSVVEKFFKSADLKNQPDAESCYALAEKLKQLPDCILDFTEDQVRDNPAWAMAVFRHKVKEMQYKRIHDLNAIGAEQEEIAILKDEVERLEPELEQRCRELNLSLGQQAVQLRQIGELKAEVERLRKAGDAIQQAFVYGKGDLHLANEAWNAAKEGKPSV